jgi:hypothetical protein
MACDSSWRIGVIVAGLATFNEINIIVKKSSSSTISVLWNLNLLYKVTLFANQSSKLTTFMESNTDFYDSLSLTKLPFIQSKSSFE